MAISIDIVIPSYRLDEKYLLPMLNLEIPRECEVHFYIVADNPRVAIPASITTLASQENVQLIINKQNLGFSLTRNKGIDAGTGDWILLLDDDVTTQPDLLANYLTYIKAQPDALGFVGVTEFPEPVNGVTKALQITGVSTHFQLARKESQMYWSATANIMLNRAKLGNTRFLPELTKSTEDMEMLFRNAYNNNLQQYIAAPQAVVHHPWWGNGSVQTKRMLAYGEGASEAAECFPLKRYTFYDFTNTPETLWLLLIWLLFSVITGLPTAYALILMFSQLVAEFVTCYYRTIKSGGTSSLSVAWQVIWHKNMMDLGRLSGNLKRGRLKGFAERIDGSFRKPHPQNFRLNRWKIIKLSLFVLLSAIGLLVYASL